MVAGRTGMALAAILAGALILRGAAAFLVQQRLDRQPDRTFLIPGDAAGYWTLGGKLAAGGPYAVHDPPRQVLRMPGFPALLAASIRLFGESLFAARLVLAVVGTAACGLAYCLGRELFDETVGLIAAGLTAVMPTLAGFSVVILSETLFAACLLGNLLVTARLVHTPMDEGHRKRGLWLAALAGLTLALATYVRPVWLVAAPLLAVLLVVLRRPPRQAVLRESGERRAESGEPRAGAGHTPGPARSTHHSSLMTHYSQAIVLLAATAAALAPWAIRNKRVTGHYVVTTLWMGPTLYDSLGPQATGASNMTFYDRDALRQKGLSEYEVDRYYRWHAWESVRDNPWRAVRLAAVKLGRFWKPWPSAAQFDHLLHRAAVFLSFVPLVALAGYGWWRFRNDPWCWLLTVGPILCFSLVHLVVVGSLRYRLPAEYPLCVMAAAGIGTLVGVKRRPGG